MDSIQLQLDGQGDRLLQADHTHKQQIQRTTVEYIASVVFYSLCKLWSDVYMDPMP